MRAPGQRWWGWLLVLPVELALGAGFLWLVRQMPTQALSDQALWLVVVMLGLVYVLVVVAPVVEAVRTRRRYLTTLATLERALHEPLRRAVPTEESEPVGDVPVPEGEPLSLLWRYRRGARGGFAASLGILVGDGYNLVLAIRNLRADTVLPTGSVHTGLPGALHLTNSLLLYVVFFVVVPAVVALPLQFVFARPFGVVAHEDSIEMRRVLGRSRVLRWEDAVYFQFVYDGDRYYLFGPRCYITWQVNRGQRREMLQPIGFAPDEAQERAKLLESVIQQRTGLPLQKIVR